MVVKENNDMYIDKWKVSIIWTMDNEYDYSSARLAV